MRKAVIAGVTFQVFRKFTTLFFYKMYRADEPAYVPNGKLWEEYTQKKPENKRFVDKKMSAAGLHGLN